jgi:heat shock protein HtpX
MPEVAMYESPEPNAFATGANRNNALVAVSTGLLEQMSAEEVEAVLGHEVSHVANGDMVTLSLLQGVLNTFVIVLARVVGYAVDLALSKNESRGPGIGYYLASFVAELLFGFLASLIVMWFSRYREFHADAGGARLAGRGKMIAALERLRQLHEPSQLPSEMAAFGINGGLGDGLRKLLMTHPPLEERIAALRQQG